MCLFKSAVLFAIISVSVFSSEVGKKYSSEKETWIDSDTGYEITKWTNERSLNWHLYFNTDGFIDENNAIIFSDRSGKINLFKLNLDNGEMTQMTDEPSGVDDDLWHWSGLNRLWYFTGNTLKELNTVDLESKTIRDFGSEKILSFTVTNDGEWFVYCVNKNPGWTENCSTGPYAVMKMNLSTLEKSQISPDYGFKMDDILANPVYPNLVMFIWQHQYREGGEGIVGYTPFRIFWLDINGKEGGMIEQEFGIHRTHEFWFPDGERIGYSARYKYPPGNESQYLGATTIDGEAFKMAAPVLYGHSKVFKDLKHWIVDYWNGMNLALVKMENEEIEDTEMLFHHGSSWQGHASHPHPQFSPDGKYIIFSTDKSGEPCVYTVKINLNDK